MIFECDGKVETCLNCPLPDCTRYSTVKRKVERKNTDRKDYMRRYYEANRDRIKEKYETNRESILKRKREKYYAKKVSA